MIEYAVEVNGVSILGTETDPHVIELFPEGENVTVSFVEDTIQVLPAGKKSGVIQIAPLPIKDNHYETIRCLVYW